jgi:hypothetical protein
VFAVAGQQQSPRDLAFEDINAIQLLSVEQRSSSKEVHREQL